MTRRTPHEVVIELYETPVLYTQEITDSIIAKATSLGSVVVSTDVLVAEPGRRHYFGEYGQRIVVLVVNNPDNDSENNHPTKVYVQKILRRRMV